ncbi:unnamed protein product [Ectocarpus sp. 12 AP-2014]
MDADEEETKTMQAVKLPEQALELAFHPHRDVLASGLVNGSVCLHTYSPEGHQLALELSHHQASCRSVLFSEDGAALYTASKDRSIAQAGETGQVTWRQEMAHDWPVNALHNVSEGILASGDDQGVIKLWDTRAKNEVAKFDVNEDFISAFATNEESDKLLATSGDATLAVFDLRQKRLEGRVTNQEDELLSIQIVKNGSRVVCGTQNGVLVSWPWGTWGDRSSRFRGHPHSVDTLLTLDEDTVLTGSSDGIIRVVSIQPDKFLGLLGDHEDFPVESIQFSRDKMWIGSVSHDNNIRFWHAGYLFEEDDDDEEEEAEQSAGASSNHATGGAGQGGRGAASATDNPDMDTDSDGHGGDGGGKGGGGADDGDDDDSDDEDGDDSDMGGDGGGGAKGGRKGGGGGGDGGGGGGRGKLPTANEAFFADL